MLISFRALDSLFTTLKTHGRDFPSEFWETICKELLFPIFAVLKSSQDMSRFNTQEDMSVWLQTTMIQALRDLIDLYTYHFDILEQSLTELLDLLCICICQGMCVVIEFYETFRKFCRKRYPGSLGDVLFTAIIRKEFRKVRCNPLGTHNHLLREVVQNDNTSSTF